MHQLTESIGKYLLAAVSPLIRQPEKAQLRVASTPSGDLVRFRLVLEQQDVARVIGRNGMTASAIRSLAKAAGEKAAPGKAAVKGAGAKDINFLAVSKSAIVQATKMALPKVFDPDTNQSKDAWLFQYRLYHDCFAYENKVKGIYVHTKA